MKKNSFFKTAAVLTIWLYSTATVLAGQVLTNAEKNWAQKVLKQEADLGAVGDTKSVAVLNYYNISGDDRYYPLQKGMALMLIADLSKLDNLHVVDRVKIQALFDELEIGPSGLADESVAPEMGNLLKATTVVSGKIGQGGIDIVQFYTNILDVTSERTKKLPPATGEFMALLKLEKEMLFSIIEQLSYQLTDDERKRLAAPLSTSAPAMLALFLGIDYSDSGNYDKAAQLYNEALAEDPGLTLAKDSLRELQDMGLVADQNMPSTKDTTLPPAEEGSSKLTYLGIGLGVVAIAAGVALAVGGSGGSSSDNNNTVTTTDDSEPTGSTEHDDTIDCQSDSVTFIFSQAMDTSSGSVSVSYLSASDQHWTGDTTYTVYFNDTSTQCSNASGSSVTLSLNNFRSSGGTALTGTTSYVFQYE